MIRKEYIVPVIDLLEISNNCILAGSDPFWDTTNGDTDGPGNDSDQDNDDSEDNL